MHNFSSSILAACQDDHSLLFTGSSGETSRHDFREWALGLASHFRSLGLAPGSKVTFYLDDGIDWIAAWHACMLAGISTVMVNHRLGVEEAKAVSESMKCDMIIAEQDIPGFPTLVRSELSQRPSTADFQIHNWHPDDVAAVFSTSGTTLNSKLVPHRHDNFLEISKRLDYFDIDENSVLLCPAKLSFGMGLVMNCLVPIVNRVKATVILDSSFSLKNLCNIINHNQVTNFYGTPLVLKMLIKDPNAKFGPHLRRVTVGGEPVPPLLCQKFVEKFSVLISNWYGMTETLFCVIMERDGHNVPKRIGQPVPGAEFRVVDEQGQDCAPYVPGRLLARFPSQSNMYLNDSKFTDMTFRDGWVWSSDIFTHDGQGNYFFVSRMFNSAKVNSRHVSCIEVEDFVSQLELAEDCVSCFYQDDYGLNQVAVFLLLGDHEPILLKDLRSRLSRNKVQSQFLPSRLFVLSEVPRTLTNKKIRDWNILTSHAKEVS